MRELSRNDFVRWMRKDFWSPKQAACIFCQIEPSSLYAEYGLKEDDEWYAVYKGLKALMREHFKGRHLGRAPLKPDEWIQWAADLNVEISAKVVKFIDDLDGVPKESPSPRASSHKRARNEKTEPLDPRTRNSLLRIIRALEVMAKLPARGSAISVERQLQQLGFNAPKEATIRNVIDEARALMRDEAAG